MLPEQLIELLILTGQCATMCATLGALHTPPDGGRTLSDGESRSGPATG
ncbi:hypothetical protein ABZZ47_02680 [Streptomyces sp. NPDC006465]